jgi:uncharacterized membrane protein
MADLIVVALDDAATAFAFRSELAKLQGEYLIEMEDVVVVTREADGRVQLHQPVNMTAVGAAGGGFWGMLVGLLFLNPLLGAAVGAGAGALSGAYTDIGINDDFMREIGATLVEGRAAVFVLVRKVAVEKVVERLEAFRNKGRLLRTSLPHDAEEKLRRAFEATEPSGLPVG